MPLILRDEGGSSPPTPIATPPAPPPPPTLTVTPPTTQVGSGSAAQSVDAAGRPIFYTDGAWYYADGSRAAGPGSVPPVGVTPPPPPGTATPSADADADGFDTGHSQDGDPLGDDTYDLDDAALEMFEAFNGAHAVAYIRTRSAELDLDPLGVFANAVSEGWHGGIGDDGKSFGPFQMEQGGALPRKYWSMPRYSPAVQRWTWSDDGIDYALRTMAKTAARGVHGKESAYLICKLFERPANTEGKAVARSGVYLGLAGAGEAVWAMLASTAKGPAGAGPAGSAPSTPVQPVTPASVVAVEDAWADLMHAYGRVWAAAEVTTKTRARQLAGVVK